MQLILLHGWGYNAGLWRQMVPLLQAHDPVLLDLGLVQEGPKGAGSMPPGAVCIGHSFGLLWLLKHGPRPIRALVSVAGFDCFHAHMPTTAIERMKAGLDRNPNAQMRAFWRACGIDDFTDPENVDVPTSRAALDWIAKWDARPRRHALGVPILALASAADQIVPKAASQAMWGDGGADLQWHRTAGHALPLTAPEWCAENILGFIDGLEP